MDNMYDTLMARLDEDASAYVSYGEARDAMDWIIYEGVEKYHGMRPQDWVRDCRDFLDASHGR